MMNRAERRRARRHETRKIGDPIGVEVDVPEEWRAGTRPGELRWSQ